MTKPLIINYHQLVMFASDCNNFSRFLVEG